MMPYNGFTIDGLFPNGANPGLFSFLERNTELPGIIVLGWFISIEGTGSSSLNIYQSFYAGGENGLSLNVGFYKTAAAVPITDTLISESQLPEMSRWSAKQVQIEPDDDNYGNNITFPTDPGAGGTRSVFTGGMARNMEYYNARSRMFFFSTSQLLAAKLMCEELEQGGVYPELVFSGSQQEVGRMVAARNSDELIELREETIRDLAENFYSVPDILDPSGTPIPDIGVSIELAESIVDLFVYPYNGERYSTWFSLKMEVNTSLVPGGAATTEIPLAFFAHPCPPSWHTGAVMYEGIVQYYNFQLQSDFPSVSKRGREEEVKKNIIKELKGLSSKRMRRSLAVTIQSILKLNRFPKIEIADLLQELKTKRERLSRTIKSNKKELEGVRASKKLFKEILRKHKKKES